MASSGYYQASEVDDGRREGQPADAGGNAGTATKNYHQTANTDKGKILDEFVVVADCHRKHAIRLLIAAPRAAASLIVARRTYNEAPSPVPGTVSHEL